MGEERWAEEATEMEPAEERRMSPRKPRRFDGWSPPGMVFVCWLLFELWWLLLLLSGERECGGARGVASPWDDERRRSGVRIGIVPTPRPRSRSRWMAVRKSWSSLE